MTSDGRQPDPPQWSDAPLSAHYYKDDAVADAGPMAELLYVRGLAFCADVLSDGYISDTQLTRFVGVRDFHGPGSTPTGPCKVDLWIRDDGGYRVRLVVQVEPHEGRDPGQAAQGCRAEGRWQAREDSERIPN